jgi:hypothetical protein
LTHHEIERAANAFRMTLDLFDTRLDLMRQNLPASISDRAAGRAPS